MSVKSYCLALILVLVSAWTHDLQARTHVIDLPQGVSPFDQEFILLATQNRADLLERIAAPFQTLTHLLVPILLPDSSSSVEVCTLETGQPVFSGDDLCNLLMSLQC